MTERKRYYTTEKEVYRLLQEITKSRGITQRQMAEDLGCTQKHLSHVFRGHGRLSVNMLFRIIQYLQVELILLP